MRQMVIGLTSAAARDYTIVEEQKFFTRDEK